MSQLTQNQLSVSKIVGDTAIPAPLAEGYLSIAMSDADKTLAAAEYANRILKFTGTLTAGRNIIVPLVAGTVYTIINATSGGFALTAKGATGTGIAVANAKTARVICDGTNVIRETADV